MKFEEIWGELKGIGGNLGEIQAVWEKIGGFKEIFEEM